MTTIVEHEAKQMNAANASGRPPVVFIHGLWLLPCSWDRWAALFEEAGYAVLTPGWPDEPETVFDANERPELFAGKSIEQVADHFAGIDFQMDPVDYSSPAVDLDQVRCRQFSHEEIP